ncbi:MAG: eukaryotic-like serine/threonine-protein kinase [Verrucomicrobiota bacterium]|jgi:non-specific serine/threonine protein kinase/serine/threonine-protein kinase
MTPERWQKVKNTLASALERPEENERAAFLAATCADDISLRREVESLLAQPDDDFDLVGGAIGVASTDRMNSPDEGRRIGNYELLRELGRGGMGTVWLAKRADQQFEKLVAIKLLKRGTDTDEVLRRFQTERQILARLEHPNIARLLDGGITDDDLPYFVMEYVDGPPVTEFCRDRALTIRQRLQLFLKICGAVQFAHQNLVVHRDLKPGNILVPPDGEPKLLDFGIAKLLAPDEAAPEVTMAEHQRFTPAYASPEQVRGEPITTVSDVYALGTLLYEILTGKNAHRFSVPHPPPTELLRVVTQEEPLRPSAAALEPSIARRLRGDLDTILLKALRKEPSRRYSGVGAFAEDIRRHLDDQPVSARRDTFSYRAAKFVQRNKIGVAAAALVLLSLVGGIIATAWEARVAQAQRARAERRFSDVRTLASSMLSELNEEAETLSGSIKLRSILVKRTLAYLDTVTQEAGDNRALQRELATAYQKVGDIQGNTYYSNLGDLNGALESYRKCLTLRETLAKAEPQNAEIRHDLALGHEGYADVLWGVNRLTETLQNYREAQATLEALIKVEPANRQWRLDLSRVYHKLGDLQGNVDYSNLGDTAGAVESKRKALILREALVGEDPSNKNFRDLLSESYLNLGKMQRITGDLPSALQNYRKALALQEEFSAAEPTNQIFRRHVMFSHRYLAVALQENGQLEEALASQRVTLKIAEELAGADSKNTQAQRTLAVSSSAVGNLLAKRGDIAGALEHYQKGTSILEGLFSANPSNAQVRRDLLIAYLGFGDTQFLAENPSAAMANYLKAKPLAEDLAAADAQNIQARSDLAALNMSLSAWKRQNGDPLSALEHCRRAVAIREELSAANPSNALTRRDLAADYSELGEVYERLASDQQTDTGQRQANWRRATEWYDKALNIWQDMKRNGILGGAETGKPDELARKIAKAEAALNLVP